MVFNEKNIMSGKSSLCLCMTAVLATTLMMSSIFSADRQFPTLQIFDCGAMEFSDIGSFSDTGEFDGWEWRVVVPCYLIRHPEGLLIWDVGVSSAMVASSDNSTGGILSMINQTLVDGLAKSSVVASDIDFIAMSHMHPDHTGNANMFAGTAAWLTSEVQFDFAFRDDAAAMGFDQDTYDELRNGPLKFVDDDHDVFGDETVRILSAPGHTPGHQVLFVDLNQHGPIILSGDLHITREGREKRLVPTFNFDRDITLASIDRIEAFLVEHDAKLIIQHSIADYESLPHAPDVLK